MKRAAAELPDLARSLHRQAKHNLAASAYSQRRKFPRRSPAALRPVEKQTFGAGPTSLPPTLARSAAFPGFFLDFPPLFAHSPDSVALRGYGSYAAFGGGAVRRRCPRLESTFPVRLAPRFLSVCGPQSCALRFLLRSRGMQRDEATSVAIDLEITERCAIC